MRRLPLHVLAWLTILFLLTPVLFVIPMSLSSSAFLQFPPPGFSLGNYGAFFSDPQWRAALLLSAKVAGGAMAISLLVGTMTSYALVRGRLGAAPLVEAIFMLPLMVPTIIFGSGAYLVELRLNLTGNVAILILAHSVLALPYVILNVGAALRATDHRLALVAQTMGASPLVAFREVTMPLIAPALLTAALLSVVLSLDETVVALFLTSDTNPTTPVKIYNTIQYELDPSVPVAATVVLGASLSVAIIFLVIRRIVALVTHAQTRRSYERETPPLAQLEPTRS